jgi:putative SOS response-associated peptidase YedK
MPVLLQRKDFDGWLTGTAGVELLKPAPNDYLQTWPVSRRVNSSRAPGDDPTLIDRIAA